MFDGIMFRGLMSGGLISDGLMPGGLMSYRHVCHAAGLTAMLAVGW